MEIPKMKENYSRGPTTGNASARKGKREEFKASKGERSNLADSINSAFAARTFNLDGPKVNAKVESVEGDVKPKKFKR
ncbi:hypothetical protein UFOVP94_35 [uncultured Caudovirales phage]|uniref:Uncharacterized protein n=1 Tax=uncultured Caudovirales phage TaxID=2100421 RepID=A0A6J5L6Y9_9CAUD|nr:hypothetical protein UFOVP94_35 [uncultured Caudovirales phage]CAB5212373.1 hypothetical protein UFOVP186_8 [uncultured Caudovirales phage]